LLQLAAVSIPLKAWKTAASMLQKAGLISYRYRKLILNPEALAQGLASVTG
jgi:hypothetical protein